MKKHKLPSQINLSILGLKTINSTDKEILNEKVTCDKFNLVPDNTTCQFSLNELKDFINNGKHFFNNVAWCMWFENVKYAEWLLTKLNVDPDKSYTMEELETLSGLDKKEFYEKIRTGEKW